jgi:hypothetical protein
MEGRDRTGVWDVMVTYPGFSEPAWQPVDPKAQRLFLGKLFRYGQIGQHGYFGSDPELRDKWPLSHFLESVERNVAEGWTFEKWTGPLFYYREESGKTSGPQRTVIQRRLIASGDNGSGSHDRPKVGYQALFVAFASSDFTGPDASLPIGASGVPTSGSSLLMFEGKPYFVGQYGSVWRPVLSTGLAQACEFEFNSGDPKRK